MAFLLLQYGILILTATHIFWLLWCYYYDCYIVTFYIKLVCDAIYRARRYACIWSKHVGNRNSSYERATKTGRSMNSTGVYPGSRSELSGCVPIEVFFFGLSWFFGLDQDQKIWQFDHKSWDCSGPFRQATVFYTDLVTTSLIDLLMDFCKDSGPLHDPWLKTKGWYQVRLSD